MDQVVAVTQRNRHRAPYPCGWRSHPSAHHSTARRQIGRGHDIAASLAATGSASTLQGVPEVVLFAIPDRVANSVVTRSARVTFA
jgi:hypothetical protein